MKLYFKVIKWLLFIVTCAKAKRSSEIKSGRLFSNPFGILGHEACGSNLEGRNVTGICYNEVECLLK